MLLFQLQTKLPDKKRNTFVQDQVAVDSIGKYITQSATASRPVPVSLTCGEKVNPVSFKNLS